ncbi:MAG: hypothetical protein RIB46_11110 [Pseudomonadales bacterium]
MKEAVHHFDLAGVRVEQQRGEGGAKLMGVAAAAGDQRQQRQRAQQAAPARLGPQARQGPKPLQRP